MTQVTTTLAVGIDSSGAQTGAAGFARSAAEIKASAAETATAVDAASASTQRMNLVIGESPAVAFAAQTRQAATAVSEYTTASTAAAAQTEITAAEFAAAAAAFDGTATAAGGAATATTAAAGSADVAAASFTLGGQGASYMARTMDMAALSALGVTGMAGRAGAAVAVFGAGSAGAAVGLAALVLGVVAVTEAYKALFTFTDPVIAQVDTLSAAWEKQASSGHDAQANYTALQERIADLKTSQDTGAMSLKDYALTALDVVVGYASMAAGMAPVTAGLEKQSQARAANTLAMHLEGQTQQASDAILVQTASNSASLANAINSLAKAHDLNGTALTKAKALYADNTTAINTYLGILSPTKDETAAFLVTLTAQNAIYDALHVAERQRITDAQAVGAAQSALQIATDNANHNALQAAKDEYAATIAADASTAALARTQQGANLTAINATQAAKDLTAALKLHSDTVAVATAAYAAYLAKLTAVAAVNQTVTDAQQSLNVAVLQSQGQFGAAAEAQQKYQEQAALRSVASVKNLTDEGLGVGALIIMLVQAKYAVLDLVAAHAQQRQATDDIAAATAALGIAQAKASGDSALASQLELAEKNRVLEVTIALDIAQKKWGDDSAAVGAQLLALGEQTNAFDAVTTKTTRNAQQGYSNLASGVRSDFDTLFEDITTQGLGAFTTFFDNVEKLFVKLLADMASQAVEKNFLTPLLGQLTGVTGSGGANNVGGTGLPLSSVANADAGTSASILPYIGVAVGIAGIVSSIIGSGEKLKAEEAVYQSNLNTFTANLDAFVANIGVAAGSLQASLNQAKASTASLQQQAFDALGSAPGFSKSNEAAAQNLFAANGVTALINSSQYKTETWLGELSGPMHTLVTSLEALTSATNTMTDAQIAAYHTSLMTAYNASLGPVGANLNTLAGYGTTRDTAVSDAATAAYGISVAPGQQVIGGGTASQAAEYTNDLNLALGAYQNNVVNFLKGLSTSDLDALLPKLTGDTLTWATAIDKADHATDDAATSAAAAAAAIAGAATQLANMQSFLITLYQTVASQSTDAETIKYNNLAALGIQQQQQKAAAQALLDSGTISVTMFNNYITALTNGWTLATNSVDGTINGMTQSTYNLAQAAQTLADNANRLTQQFTVFGTSLDDQVTQTAKLYGLQGKSIADLQGMYVTVTPGQELTTAQQTLDDQIAKVIGLMQSAATADAQTAATTAATSAATAVTATSAASTGATTTYGPSQPIIGPNGTFYITVTVALDKDQMSDGEEIGTQVAAAVDRAFQRRAGLIASASGQTP